MLRVVLFRWNEIYKYLCIYISRINEMYIANLHAETGVGNAQNESLKSLLRRFVSRCCLITLHCKYETSRKYRGTARD